ncbi:glycoside hydrolase family 16 protein [Candidatus Mycolicibacterium alkanivorans]|uniref:Glycoside hydrolase family 16 protein n=1 Tax=Candidatus Mycolicibacterium alkanivorans TaxID=2954114 RepID=A0ABS9YRA8_9MYCO|nr:glycoside hydrolase family 16 protein [Candidatus Mycolicibacterium alkanivorans]MCI4673771.1 glycoside hydrolase family 16 protein [Candidatus Mycolicibacterium alkanivorans]
MDRRSLMFLAGFGAIAAALPAPLAAATPSRPEAPADRVPAPAAPAANAAVPSYLFHDEFDGPAGSAPDPSKWNISKAREMIKNPVFWDRPENMGQYRDDREHVFLDGNSNLVIRATRDDKYVSGKVVGTWWGGIGTTWEARIKFNCLTAGAWPACWLMNDHPEVGAEVDLVEWYGNGEWPSGTTVHARLDGTSFATTPVGVDTNWHTWRVTWNDSGMYFWQDYVDGKEPYFAVPANSLDDWPFNFPDYRMFPVLNLAVSGSGGGDPRPGNYPADMIVDYVRVW